MHDLILALSFVSLIVTPAIFASRSDKQTPAPIQQKKTPKADLPSRREAAKSVRISYASTLPLHRTRALAGR